MCVAYDQYRYTLLVAALAQVRAVAGPSQDCEFPGLVPALDTFVF